MNNALLTEMYVESVEKTNSPAELNQREKQLLQTLAALKTTRAYADFISLFIQPNIDSLVKQLRVETEQTAIYRLQGEIDGLEVFKKLSGIENYLRGRVAAYGKKE